jgi:hypothetical protein
MIQRIVTAIAKANSYYLQVLKTKHPRLVYAGGWLGYSNLGDEALFQAYKKIFYNYNLIHYPSPGGRVLSIPSKLFNIGDTAVLAGGTLIYLPSHLKVSKECLSLFPKFFVFGTGVADPSFYTRKPGWKDNLQNWKPVLEYCKYVGVRGPRSAELLFELGIKTVEVVGDPVIIFADDNLCSQEFIIPNSIGLNIGITKIGIFGNQELLQREFVKLATLAKQAGWKIRWLVVMPGDLHITIQTAKESDTEEDIHQVYSDYAQYLNLVRPMSTFVGMKLHAVALATCAYVPSLMLEYQPKCRDYMETIGQTENTIRTDTFRAETVWEIIEGLNSHRHKTALELYSQIKRAKDNLISKASNLMNMLGR